jgi:hypothetical protein
MKAYETLSASKDPDDRALAAKFKPQKRFFVPCIKYKEPKGGEVDDRGPKLFLLVPGLYGEILDLYLDEDDGGDFTNEIKGYDLKISRIGKGKMDTKYSVIKCDKSKLPQKFRGKVYDPKEMVTELVPSFKEAKQKIDEFLSLPPEDDDDTRKKKTSKEVVKKKKRSRDL